MHISSISYCLLALSASSGALAAPRIKDHAMANRGTPEAKAQAQATPAIARRSTDGQMEGQPWPGMPEGMCMYPCAGSSGSQDSGMMGQGKQKGWNDGASEWAMDSGSEDEAQKDNDDKLKNKYMSLVEQNQDNWDKKNKHRQKEMENKYQDLTVAVEIVHIIIEIDIAGNQMPERYAMSKLWANNGKDKTTTCHMTAAEKMTIGSGACGSIPADVELPAFATSADSSKDMNMMNSMSTGDSMSKPSATADMNKGKEMKDNGGKDDEKMKGDQMKEDEKMKGEQKMNEDGKMKGEKQMNEDDKKKGEQQMNEGAKKKGEQQMNEDDKKKGEQQMNEDEKKKGEQQMNEDDKKKGEQQMNEDDKKKGEQQMDEDEKKKGEQKMNEDEKKKGEQKMNENDKMKQDQSPQTDQATPPPPSYAIKPRNHPHPHRRQTGGTAGWVLSPMLAPNDTLIMPIEAGAPKPQPGYAVVDDPAVDVGKEGWVGKCGL